MNLAWYCIRSQPKHEHIAAAHLRLEPGMDVYLPRIRFRRSTRLGPVWFTEPLFPNYLFVRFDLETGLRQVHYTPGVSGVIHFGDHWPEIPGAVIEDLQSVVGPDELHLVDEGLAPDDPVVISGGAFHDLRAVVTRVMPGRQRVIVLLEFLGRQTALELSVGAVVAEGGIFGGLR